jgi:[ribosomal protein S18]-alanine N-acetyltransferase
VESAIIIRHLARSDADSILAIQSSCPELAQWSKHDYQEIAHGNTAGWVGSRTTIRARNEVASAERIVGFITARIAADEIEILNLGVAPDQRRRGIAKALLQAALKWGTDHHARQAFLEVRASNSAAIRFYESFGFQTAGRRTNYYTSPKEDALQLSARIP